MSDIVRRLNVSRRSLSKVVSSKRKLDETRDTSPPRATLCPSSKSESQGGSPILSRKVQNTTRSPNASHLLNQDNSFFNDHIEDILLQAEETTGLGSDEKENRLQDKETPRKDLFSDDSEDIFENSDDDLLFTTPKIAPIKTPGSGGSKSPRNRTPKIPHSSTPVTITPCRRGSRFHLSSTPSSDGSETSRNRTPLTQKSAKDNNCREDSRSSLPKPRIISPEVPTQKTQYTCESSGDSQDSQLISSLPLSVLDIRKRVLEEPLTPKPVQKITAGNPEPQFANVNLVSENCDRGPFFGLPDRVRELYRELKGISELFPWQSECLLSGAVQSKLNLLYSLPTSGGKTLVAEIIMLQELLCYRKNCIFVLPYVSLVQEKIRSLAPFALELGFYLEEYAGSRGRFPPVKRIHKNSLFVCTIEKAHALFNSLVVENRLDEVGLVVVDEVHMLGEDTRGANLESFLAKLKYLNGTWSTKIQIISMSATVGNLTELSRFLESELYTDSWRPVQLEENIKVGREVYSVTPQESEQFRLKRKLDVGNYNQEMIKMDEDYLTNLVLEVFPEHSCLVFCDTKKRCENVAEMICRIIFRQPEPANKVLNHKREERKQLRQSLLQDGAGYICPILQRTLEYGVAYHHSGLTMDERKVLEEGFLSGCIGVLCCTSTLAAGVNLPARRVIIRSPFMGRNQLSHTQYKQMIGRAGRAGLDTKGESFLMVKPNQVQLVTDVVTSPVEHCISSLHKSGSLGLATLVLNCMYLGLITTPQDAKQIVGQTLLWIQADKLSVNLENELTASFDLLFNNNLITTVDESLATQQGIHISTQIKPTRLGRAAIQGNINLSLSGKLYSDLKDARPRLAVDTCLHLLYLLTPYDLAESIYYTASVYHRVYLSLSLPDLEVARFLGITENIIVGLVTGRGFPKALKPVLSRFYLALVLLDLWNTVPIHTVAEKFSISRGEVQNLMSSAASFSSSVLHFCLEIEEFWAYQELLEPFTKRLAHCCSPELLPLLDLPGVKAGRAKLLLQAGYSSLGCIAKAEPGDLVRGIPNLSHKAAKLIVQSAKLQLIEKAEGLHDEADIVLLDIA